MQQAAKKTTLLTRLQIVKCAVIGQLLIVIAAFSTLIQVFHSCIFLLPLPGVALSSLIFSSSKGSVSSLL